MSWCFTTIVMVDPTLNYHNSLFSTWECTKLHQRRKNKLLNYVSTSLTLVLDSWVSQTCFFALSCSPHCLSMVSDVHAARSCSCNGTRAWDKCLSPRLCYFPVSTKLDAAPQPAFRVDYSNRFSPEKPAPCSSPFGTIAHFRARCFRSIWITSNENLIK